jgi:hypothetical protein
MIRGSLGRIRTRRRKTKLMKLRIFLVILTLACATSLSQTHAEDRVLFAFDDHSIPWRHNLRVTLVQADKHPENPVLRRGPKGAPDSSHAILYGTVIKDKDKFRMWYLGSFDAKQLKTPAPNYWRPMCYAESLDGIHWTKPDLGLVEFNGNTKNNICLIGGNPHSLTLVNDFLSVMHDPGDPDPSKLFKVAYIAHMPYEEIIGGMSKIGRKEKRVCSTICATSADGLTWNVLGDRPANASGERFEVSGLYRFGDFYYSPGQIIGPWSWQADGSFRRDPDRSDPDRVMRVYRSSDFRSWSQATALGFARPGQLANPPVKGQQTHMGAGMWNRGNVIIGLYGRWQDATEKPPAKLWNKGISIDLGLVVSNDGIHFREPVANHKVIALGKEGEWDDVALLQGHAFVNEGDKTMIWYSHWDTSGQGKPMEIGLATLRRDGFGYLSAQEEDNDSEFITDFVELDENEKIHLNVSGVSPDAPLTVELLDRRAQPIPGYAATVSTNGLRVPVVWSKPATASGKRALRIRYPVGSQAHVYAVYITGQNRPESAGTE